MDMTNIRHQCHGKQFLTTEIIDMQSVVPDAFLMIGRPQDVRGTCPVRYLPKSQEGSRFGRADGRLRMKGMVKNNFQFL